MEEKKISGWIRAALVAVTLFGTLIYGWVIPMVIESSLASAPEFAFWYWPWMCFLWATAIPCYLVVFFAYKISCEIERDNSFSHATARYLKNIALLIFGDVAFFFVGNIVLILLSMHHPGIFLLSLAVDVAGIIIGLAAAILSRFVSKAAVLQEESDGTV